MTRPTTLVESDQLAAAAVNILKYEDFVPKGKRWPFAKFSKAHRDYDKAVQDIATRRRTTRERAIEEKLRNERNEADAAFERTKTSAETEHREKVAEARKPYDETESKARSQRDAAIAAAHAAYQQAIDAAQRTYQQEAAVLDQKRDEVIIHAKSARAEVYATIEATRANELQRIARELKTIPLEGPMRVVEDREAWSVEDRKKALIGLVDMAGRDDFDAEITDLCLKNVAGYVFQDRFLKPTDQHHRLMDVVLLEAIVDLARRTPERRPIIVKYIHEIVSNNPGHSSPSFIKSLTELYVLASSDTETVYFGNPVENEKVFDEMREQIADALKLTPRRSQVPPSASGAFASRDASAQASSGAAATSPSEITADVDLHDLVPLDRNDPSAAASEAVVEAGAPGGGAAQANRPPPMPSSRRKRAPVPERNS